MLAYMEFSSNQSLLEYFWHNVQGNPAAAKILGFQNPPDPPIGFTVWLGILFSFHLAALFKVLFLLSRQTDHLIESVHDCSSPLSKLPAMLGRVRLFRPSTRLRSFLCEHIGRTANASRVAVQKCVRRQPLLEQVGDGFATKIGLD